MENLKKLNFNIVFVILSFRRKRPSGLQGVAVAKKSLTFKEILRFAQYDKIQRLLKNSVIKS